MNLANNLVFFGNRYRQGHFQRCYKQPPQFPQAHWGLANDSRAADSEHIGQMQGLLARNRGNLRGQGFLHYAMGKEYEDLGEWPKPSPSRQGARPGRRSNTMRREETLFEVVTGLFNAKWLKRPRTGTGPFPHLRAGSAPRATLIERIITSHSQVHSAGELQHLACPFAGWPRFTTPSFQSRLFQAAAA